MTKQDKEDREILQALYDTQTTLISANNTHPYLLDRLKVAGTIRRARQRLELNYEK